MNQPKKKEEASANEFRFGKHGGALKMSPTQERF